jgi:hypothetical protein
VSTARITSFVPAEFEAVLHAEWPSARCVGIQRGEYVWVVPVVPDETIGIIIRSTIREDGVSAPAGADSIRCWIGSFPDGEPWAPKLSVRWATRRAGWESRLRGVIEELIALAGYIRPCPECGVWMKLGRPHGTLQLRCDARAEGMRWFDGTGCPIEIPGERCRHTEPVEPGANIAVLTDSS